MAFCSCIYFIHLKPKLHLYINQKGYINVKNVTDVRYACFFSAKTEPPYSKITQNFGTIFLKERVCSESQRKEEFMKIKFSVLKKWEIFSLEL